MVTTLIFPHQLFEFNPVLTKDMRIYLVEEYLFFDQYRFHKQKLAFHRASMKSYEQFLRDRKYNVVYVECHRPQSDVRKLIPTLETERLEVLDPVDNYLERRIRESCTKCGLPLEMYESPLFINTKDDLKGFFKPSKKKFFQTEFYKQQRQSLGILMEDTGKPKGGKWTYDVDNRKRYPPKKIPPSIHYPEPDILFEEAVAYVHRHFPENPGELGQQVLYPYTFESAKDWFQQFLQYRFAEFGDYEDALVAEYSILHHSVLSPLINVGLLSPQYVVDEVLDFVQANDIRLNNTEGLIRQIIGWREFIRGVYQVKGTEERRRNFWGFDRKIPKSFYDGSTGIPPVDITIKKVLKTGYNHHIERLMVLGNFMLLCEFHPDEVYRWFMELYIDAYDWVMVPNVYGMSQFADGGLMSTKPYISGSNYLIKMGNYGKGEWQRVWDGLFWRFMHVHRDFFLGNPRLGMLVRTFDKMSDEKRTEHLKNAEAFLAQL